MEEILVNLNIRLILLYLLYNLYFTLQTDKFKKLYFFLEKNIKQAGIYVIRSKVEIYF